MGREYIHDRDTNNAEQVYQAKDAPYYKNRKQSSYRVGCCQRIPFCGREGLLRLVE
jgi:hypothetical protein